MRIAPTHPPAVTSRHHEVAVRDQLPIRCGETSQNKSADKYIHSDTKRD